MAKKFILRGMMASLSLLGLAATVSIFSEHRIQAQDVPPPVDVQVEVLQNDPNDPRIQQLQADYAAASNASISNFRVAYFAQPDAIAGDSPSAPARLASMGLQSAFTAQDLLALDTSTPLQGVVIHASALSSVDQSWVRNVYRRGAVIAGINLTVGEMSTLLGDACLSRHGFTSNSLNAYSSDFFLAFYYDMSPVNESDRAAINATNLESCSSPADAGFIAERGYQLTEGFVQGAVDDAFTRTLAFYLHDINSN